MTAVPRRTAMIPYATGGSTIDGKAPVSLPCEPWERPDPPRLRVVAGTTTEPVARPWTTRDERRAEIARLTEAGVPPARIAALMGLPRSTVANDVLRNRMGLARKPVRHEPFIGEHTKPKVIERRRQVAALKNAGLTNTAIMRKLGLARWTVKNDLAAGRVG